MPICMSKKPKSVDLLVGLVKSLQVKKAVLETPKIARMKTSAVWERLVHRTINVGAKKGKTMLMRLKNVGSLVG